MMVGRKSISPFLGETGTEDVHRGGSMTAVLILHSGCVLRVMGADGGETSLGDGVELLR